MTHLIINGASGRMGRRLVALALDDKTLHLAGALESPGHSDLDKDAGALAGARDAGVKISDTLGDAGDVLIDFTVPAGTRAAIEMCLAKKMSMVIGTTGLGAEDHELIGAASHQVAVLQAPNMSLGVNLLFVLAAQVAARLGDDYDIEITETHHRFKKDAPSGTAMGLAQAICDATGKSIEHDVIHGRHGDDVVRQRGEIGMHALRSGDVVGRHTASFSTLGEELQLTHIASTRDVFVHGALRAAKWLTGKPAGRYTMQDVLGL
jgi:4-hydroxy-tetrahydrodipicolinate reductase